MWPRKIQNFVIQIAQGQFVNCPYAHTIMLPI